MPTYAVSVESATGPRLLCRLARRNSGIYLMIPREDPGFSIIHGHKCIKIDAHVSYHTDGEYHVKSYGRGMVSASHPQHRLDKDFHGAVPLYAHAIPPGDESLLTTPCQPEK